MAEQGGKGAAKPGADSSGGRGSVTWLRLDDLKESPAGRGFVQRLDGVREAHEVFRFVDVKCVCTKYCWRAPSLPVRVRDGMIFFVGEELEKSWRETSLHSQYFSAVVPLYANNHLLSCVRRYFVNSLSLSIGVETLSQCL